METLRVGGALACAVRRYGSVVYLDCVVLSMALELGGPAALMLRAANGSLMGRFSLVRPRGFPWWCGSGNC